MSDQDQQLQYMPHQVRIQLIDAYGAPVSDITVTAVGEETTLPDAVLSWFTKLFGFEDDENPIKDQEMQGTTDSTGSIVFMMIEGVKYQLSFSNLEDGLILEKSLYPKEDSYLFQVSSLMSHRAPLAEVVTWDISATGSEGSVLLGVSYADTQQQTTAFQFYVKDASGDTIHSETCEGSTINVSYAVEDETGKSYTWGFEAEHDVYGSLADGKGITLKGGKRLIDLGLAEEDEFLYTWIALGLIFLVGALFSAISVRAGCAIVPLFSAFVTWIGWLSISWTIISVCIALGVVLYMVKSEGR